MEDASDEGDIKPEDPSAEEFAEMFAERADMMKNVGKKVTFAGYPTNQPM